MVLVLSEWLRLPGEAGCVHTHNTQKAIVTVTHGGVCIEGMQRGRTSAGDQLVWGNLVQEVPLEQVTMAGWPSTPRSSSPVVSVLGLPPSTGPQKDLSLLLCSLQYPRFQTTGCR